MAHNQIALYKDYSRKTGANNVPYAYSTNTVMKRRFLEAFELIGHVGNTCRIVNIVPRTLYHWRWLDKDFEQQFLIASERALMLLEDEAWRRAVIGIEKPIYQRGVLVGFVKEYSDNLLAILLKARAPEKYGNKQSDQPQTNNMFNIVHVHSNTPLANDEQDIMLERDEHGNYSLPADLPETPIIIIEEDPDIQALLG